MILLFATSALAQDQPPIFRSGTELVRLDVRVTDGGGRPIEDIRAEEFEIQEGDVRRPVRLFQHVHESALSFAEAAAEAIAAEVSTNVGAPRGNVYVLVFDRLHITPGREQRVRVAAERFIDRYLRPGDRIAVFSLPGPGPAQPPTADFEKARASLASLRGGAALSGRGGIGSSAMTMYEAWRIVRGDDTLAYRLADRFSRDPSYAGLVSFDTVDQAIRLIREEAEREVAHADMEARTFLLSLADAMRLIRGIEGRKAVVVFSEGFIIDHVADELDTVAAAAADSYSVVYGVDLNSLDLLTFERTEQVEQMTAEFGERRHPLATLASETDGRLVSNATNFDQIFANIAAEANDYYLLGFEPAADDQQGHYRRVSVRLDRPGVVVRARTGYAVPVPPTPATRRRSIDQALAAPYAVTALPIELTTFTRRGSATGKQQVILSLAASLPAGGNPDQQADVVFVTRNLRTGQVAASGTDQLSLPDPADVRPGQFVPVPYRVQFEVAPGDYLMRVVVREPGGLIGTADRRFRVRALDGPGVTTSDLLLAPGMNRAFELPTRAAVRAGETLDAYLEVYGASAESLNPSIEVVDTAGRTLLTSNAAVAEAAGGWIVRAAVPAAGLPAGRHTARVRIQVRDGGTLLASRSFDVLAGDSVDVPVPRAGTPPEQASASDHAPLIFDAQRFLALADVKAYRARLTASDPAHAVLRAAFETFARADYHSAALELERLVDAGTRDAWSALLLGACHAAMGKETEAIGAWRLAAYLDPRLLQTHLHLADAYLRLHEPALARQALESGLTALPDSTELQEKLAELPQ